MKNLKNIKNKQEEIKFHINSFVKASKRKNNEYLAFRKYATN